jgi:hypothetical protein
MLARVVRRGPLIGFPSAPLIGSPRPELLEQLLFSRNGES